ncbi:putative asparagine synthase [Mycena polygramma]|nr:putative asparagine synthase [Mycena polygramma]
MQEQGYSFKWKSDSELVVQLYKRDGFNMLSQLRGEFAFVLYDVERRLQFVVRDRFGIKPLYYTVSDGCILFASEMKAFMGLGWQAEWDVASILETGDFCDERTVFKGAQKLPAGYFAICRPTGSIRAGAANRSRAPAAALRRTAGRISQRRDRSSAVAGIATHLLREKNPNAKLTTFTLAFVEDETTDESPLAERTAAHIDADLVKVPATEERLVSVLEKSIWHSEQPTSTLHGAGKVLLSQAVRDAGFEVALSGEGYDEIFGGYAWFPLDYLRDADPTGAALGLALPSAAERASLSAEYHAATGMLPLPPAALSLRKADGPRQLLHVSSHISLAAQVPPTTMFRVEAFTWNGVTSKNIVRCTEEGVDARVREHSVSGYWHSLHVSQYVVAKTLLGRRILNFIGDRNDMANSIESRVSFLDHHLVEYVNSLPPSVKIMPIAGNEPGKWTLVEKWILREAVKPFITEEIYLRKKVAFNPPPTPATAVPSALNPLQKHFKARITQASVEKLGFVDWPFVRDQLEGYLEAPTFPEGGKMDRRAAVLLAVLSLIVLQERFNVASYMG